MAIKKRKNIKVEPCNKTCDETNKDKKKFTANDSEIDITIENARWEHLVEEKNKAVDAMIANQGLITGLINQLKTKFDVLKPYNEVLIGLFKSFEDISNLLRQNMECHVNFDENNKMIDYKKGKVSSDNGEFADYLKIYGNYLFACEQIGDLTYKAYADIISLVRESDEFHKLDNVTKNTVMSQIEEMNKTNTGESNE